MIENDRQYEVTNIQIKAFQMAIAVNLRVGPEDIAPELFIAMLQGFQSQIDEMEENIEEYFDRLLVSYGLGPTLDNSEEV